MLKLISYSTKDISDISNAIDLPENRKKSLNMLLATIVSKDVLEKTSKEIDLKEFDLYFCSGEGEIQQTFEYFKFLSQNHARPILFQNSLHNSTLGALSLELKGVCNAATVSSGDLSFESAIDLALSSPTKRPILIIGVDIYNKEVKAVRQNSYGQDIHVDDGAVAALFLPEHYPEFNKFKGSVIKDIKFLNGGDAHVSKHFWPSNGLLQILEGLNEGKDFQYSRPKGHLVSVGLGHV